MALPLRPRARPCSISSRYASQTLADGGETPCFCEKGAIKSGVTSMAGFAPESGVTCMAGFAGARRPHPARNTATPAVFRYPLAVSLRTPVASSMRRKDHPSFPSAITCCFLSLLKTLLMPREPIRAPSGVNVPGFPMAGFQLTLYGRIWVTPEVQTREDNWVAYRASGLYFDLCAHSLWQVFDFRCRDSPMECLGSFRSLESVATLTG